MEGGGGGWSDGAPALVDKWLALSAKLAKAVSGVVWFVDWVLGWLVCWTDWSVGWTDLLVGFIGYFDGQACGRLVVWLLALTLASFPSCLGDCTAHHRTALCALTLHTVVRCFASLVWRPWFCIFLF